MTISIVSAFSAYSEKGMVPTNVQTTSGLLITSYNRRTDCMDDNVNNRTTCVLLITKRIYEDSKFDNCDFIYRLDSKIALISIQS